MIVALVTPSTITPPTMSPMAMMRPGPVTGTKSL